MGKYMSLYYPRYLTRTQHSSLVLLLLLELVCGGLVLGLVPRGFSPTGLVSRLVLGGPVLGAVSTSPPRLLVASVLKDGELNDGTEVTSLLEEG